MFTLPSESYSWQPDCWGERSHVQVDSWWWARYTLPSEPYSWLPGCWVKAHMYGLIPDDELGIHCPLSHSVGCLAAGVKDDRSHVWFDTWWWAVYIPYPLSHTVGCLAAWVKDDRSHVWFDTWWWAVYIPYPLSHTVGWLAAWVKDDRSHVWFDTWWWAVYIPYPLSHTVGCLAAGGMTDGLIPDDELCIPYPLSHTVGCLAAWVKDDRSHVWFDTWWWAVYIPYPLSHTVGCLAAWVKDDRSHVWFDTWWWAVYIPYPLSHTVGWLAVCWLAGWKITWLCSAGSCRGCLLSLATVPSCCIPIGRPAPPDNNHHLLSIATPNPTLRHTLNHPRPPPPPIGHIWNYFRYHFSLVAGLTSWQWMKAFPELPHSSLS